MPSCCACGKVHAKPRSQKTRREVDKKRDMKKRTFLHTHGLKKKRKLFATSLTASLVTTVGAKAKPRSQLPSERTDLGEDRKGLRVAASGNVRKRVHV